MGTRSQNFSHGEKAQLGTPAACLSFPSQHVLVLQAPSLMVLTLFVLSVGLWWCFTAYLRLVIHSLLLFTLRLVNSLIQNWECGSHGSLDCTEQCVEAEVRAGMPKPGICKSTEVAGAEIVCEGEREGLLEAGSLCHTGMGTSRPREGLSRTLCIEFGTITLVGRRWSVRKQDSFSETERPIRRLSEPPSWERGNTRLLVYTG